MESQAKFSQIEQADSHPMVKEIQESLLQSEVDQSLKNLQGCVLPNTTCQFIESENIKDLKEIRGLTPQTNLKVTIDNSLSSLLVSKTNIACRFAAVD
mmetsp:Transcript_843/g.1517  ORF Transcript_843/g.1517 Transcript_843/m.1517 type:complete len:98 (-) Transcript_843:637-930(-)